MSNQSVEDDSLTTLSDSVLLERVRQGDTSSFEELFHRHYDRVYGLLFRLLGNRTEAEDVTQEVFLKLYKRPLKGNREHNVGAWLYRVATNMGYNHLKSQKRRWRRNTVLLSVESDVSSSPLNILEQKEKKAVVRRTLTRLPQRQAKLLLLRQMGLSYAELASFVEVSPASVGTLLARAAEAFRKAYEEERDEHSLR